MHVNPAKVTTCICLLTMLSTQHTIFPTCLHNTLNIQSVHSTPRHFSCLTSSRKPPKHKKSGSQNYCPNSPDSRKRLVFYTFSTLYFSTLDINTTHSTWYVADENIDYQQTALAVSHVPFLKNPEKIKEVISEDCLKSLLSAPEHSKIGIRDTTIMVILYDSAIRLSELLNLKISDVNLQKSTPYLRIHGKGDKERIVSISDNTVAHIKRYMRYYHEESILTMDYLFYTIIHGQPHQMSPSNVERIINKYADMIRNKHPDLPQKVHPHMFRRTRATDLYQSGFSTILLSFDNSIFICYHINIKGHYW